MRDSVAWRLLAGVASGVAVALALVALKAVISPPVKLRVSPDNEATLETVVLHYDPKAAPIIDETYRGILGALPEANFVIPVAAEADFRDFLTRFAPPRPERFKPVVMDRPITTWSRDRYTMAREGDRRVLLVPPQKASLHGPRANDWLVPWRLVLGDDDAEVRELDLDFDGGDMITAADRVFVDANLIRKNPSALPNAGAVASTLEPILGRPVFVLGQRPEDVPHHHIGMYLTPLPDGAVAVGSPALAVSLLGGERGEAFEALQARLRDEGMPQVDLSEATLHRFEFPAQQLRAAGYRVVPVPLVPLADMVTFITYNNGQFHAEGQRREFLMPTYGLPVLDEAAVEIYAQHGIQARPIDVTAVFRHHGSVRCLINVL